MPWLPLAILLVAVLTIAALTLILFPPGEGGAQAAEGDISDDFGEEMAEADVADDGDDLTPPPAGGTAPTAVGTRPRGEGEEAPPESELEAGSARRSDVGTGA